MPKYSLSKCSSLNTYSLSFSISPRQSYLEKQTIPFPELTLPKKEIGLKKSSFPIVTVSYFWWWNFAAKINEPRFNQLLRQNLPWKILINFDDLTCVWPFVIYLVCLKLTKPTLKLTAKTNAPKDCKRKWRWANFFPKWYFLHVLTFRDVWMETRVSGNNTAWSK